MQIFDLLILTEFESVQSKHYKPVDTRQPDFTTEATQELIVAFPSLFCRKMPQNEQAFKADTY